MPNRPPTPPAHELDAAAHSTNDATMPSPTPSTPYTSTPTPPAPRERVTVMPTTDDGKPDYPAINTIIADEIVSERHDMWHEAVTKDKRGVLNHDLISPPPMVAPWLGYAPKKEVKPRPTLGEMSQFLTRNQLGDAELLRGELMGHMSFDHKVEKWLRFDGIVWRDDDINDVILRAMAIAEVYENAAEDKKNQRASEVEAAVNKARDRHKDEESAEAKIAIENAKNRARSRNESVATAFKKRASTIRTLTRAKQIMQIAAAGPNSLGVAGDGWDKHPTLLACANGVIDLETGLLHESSYTLMLKKQTAHAYEGLHCQSSFWDEHLQKVFCKRLDLIDYFERVIGYAATGLISHKEMYCAYGPTANNGKSQTFNAIADAIGSYAGTFKVSVLLEDGQKASGPDPDLMVLDGLRMAVTSEPKRNAKFSMEMLKAVTGDDVIRVRGLYADPIEMHAKCKLFLHTNFIPQMKNADKAFEKRLRVIPFEATFTMNDDEVDESKHRYKGLPSDKLKAEMAKAGPAILAWVVRCARRFLQDRDLTPPNIVIECTKEYADEQDIVEEFIKQACDEDANAKIQAKELYGAFVNWCRDEKGIKEKFIMSQRSFGDDMKGKVHKKTSNKTWYLGIKPHAEWLIDDNTNGNKKNLFP
ncbi:MAG: phage/plasmid primase, P4 family [Pseudomonadota bacterium]